MYSQPGCHAFVFLQSFSKACSHVIPFVNTSNASCGALCATIAIVFPKIISPIYNVINNIPDFYIIAYNISKIKQILKCFTLFHVEQKRKEQARMPAPSAWMWV